ncbi:MAG: BMP family ABC transporter substrate-binding protein [Proteobacteria bacterium]|nr:BMP family ABC transporter substrate-binding protein [Pseudomonadota bacterium]
MFKKVLMLPFVAAALALSPAAVAEDKMKVGFVYVSPIGDAGWTYQHDLGRLALEKALGDKITTSYVESVPEGADAERVINGLAGKGHQLIFTTSFGYMEPTLKAAKRHSKVTFEHATGYKTSPNMGNYSPRFYEGRYLGGMIAGANTTSNVIGYVAAFPIPEVIRGINAFTLGAQSVNPDISVKVIWVNSWYDPGKEREAAETLISQGADVVTHHTDSPAIVQAAQERGKYAVAYHSDMRQFGEDAQLAAVIHQWENFYINRVQEVLDGKWESSSVWQGIKDGMVDVVLNENKLKQDLISQVQQKRADISNGNFHPFQGPVKKQDGSMAVAENAVLSDGDLATMNYYVMGVEGQVPQ